MARLIVGNCFLSNGASPGRGGQGGGGGGGVEEAVGDGALQGDSKVREYSAFLFILTGSRVSRK